MRTADFDYDLPPDRIATRPAVPRDAARLLVVPRGEGEFDDRVVRDLPDLLAPGDLLVVNDTRVIPARLAATRADTGGAVEVFLVRPTGDGRWRVLLAPGRRMRPGIRLTLGEGVSCVIDDVDAGGDRIVRFEGTDDVVAFAERVGATPLPPYVRRAADARDRLDYQTVFAREPGAVAAPTAGLHFTDDLLARLRARGISTATVTLHVGPGRSARSRPTTWTRIRWTPRPTTCRRRRPPRSRPRAARAAAWSPSGRRWSARSSRRRPTTGRARGPGETTLFVRPGFRFRVVDAL
jgi:S-adenosylmethionine:tRNA ribosyltransferase-isomerase